MLLLIEILDTIAGLFVLAEVCLVLLHIELRIIVPQLQFLNVHCMGIVRQCDQGRRSVEKVHRPSSTASETSSKARPSRFCVVAWVVVRAGIVEESQAKVVVKIWGGSEGSVVVLKCRGKRMAF